MPLRVLLYTVILCCLSRMASGQTYYAVTTTYGSQTFGGVTVTVSHTGSVSSFTACGAGPYLGNIYFAVGGYKYVFSSPVNHIVSTVASMNPGDTITMRSQGAHYNVTASNMSAVSGACSGYAYSYAIANGNLCGVAQNNSLVKFSYNSGTSIDSFEIAELSAGGDGASWSFSFATNCPALNFVASADTPCIGSTLHLSVPTVGAASTYYTWTGPNGFSSTSQNPSISNVTAAAAGVYNVVAHYYATTADTCVYTSSVTVTTRPLPLQAIVSSNSPVCAGDTLQLSAYSATPGVTYQWTGPNNTNIAQANLNKANMSFADTGNYYLNVLLNGCSLNSYTLVQAKPLPAVPTAGSNSPACSTGPLNLNASCQTSGASYTWTGPNNFSSTQQTPAIFPLQYADSGTYTVKAIVNGCKSSNTTHVSIVQGPDSVYFSANSPVCSGDTLQWTSGSAVNNVVYQWSGPNNFVSATAANMITNVATIYSGAYYLTASLAGCVVHDTLNMVVNPKPLAPSVSSNSPVCLGSNIYFNALSATPGVSYVWTGPAGFSSAQQGPLRPNIIWADSGQYTVKAILGQCNAGSSTYVNIKPIPSAPAMTSNAPVCAGDTLQLFANDSNVNVQYYWMGPNAFSANSQNCSVNNISLADSGDYYVGLTLNGCTIFDTLHVVVKPLPQAPGIVNNSPVCANGNITLGISAYTTGAGYQWSGPNNYLSTHAADTIVNVAMLNEGYYVMHVTLNACHAKDSSYVTVNPRPASPQISANSPACQNDTLKLHAASSSPGVSYSWTGPNNFTSSLQDPSINSVSLGAAGVYAVVYTLNGCKDTLTVPVTVNQASGPPVVSIYVLPGDTVCAGSSITFNALASNAGSPVYHWMQNGASVGTNTSSYTTATVQNGDIFTCEVLGNLVCQLLNTTTSNAINMQVQLIAPPLTTVTHYPQSYNTGMAVTFTGHVPTGSAGLTYKWMKNGVFIPGATASFYTTNSVSPTDNICFVAYSNVPCTFPDSSVACTATMGIPPNALKGGLQIFPNPFGESLSLSISEGEGTVRVYNAIGQLVHSANVHEGLNSIDMRGFAAGVYIVQLLYSDGTKDVVRVAKEGR